MSKYQSPQMQYLGGKNGVTPQGVPAVLPVAIVALAAVVNVAAVVNATVTWNVNTWG